MVEIDIKTIFNETRELKTKNKSSKNLLHGVNQTLKWNKKYKMHVKY